MKRLLLAAALVVPLAALLVACSPPAPPSAITVPSRPDPRLTPGVVATTNPADVCPHVAAWLEQPRVLQSTYRHVYANYRLHYPQSRGTYELDHLISRELGGAPLDPRNLWPEPNDHPRPGFANSKDILENRLHDDVCAGRITLTQAQHTIRIGWK